MPEQQPKNIPLRQWCVEMAIKWPMTHAQPAEEAKPVDALARAQEIFDWVNE